ncbi:MAG: DUF5658 family protein [Pyrinomonadaceae bacterium]
MQLTRYTALLFILNFLDAVFTLYWVRFGYAEEANKLMASLLDMGDFPFLFVKIAIGAAAAYVLTQWGKYRIAKCGVALCLGIYIGLMVIHVITGLSVLGVIPETMIAQFQTFTKTFFAMASFN